MNVLLLDAYDSFVYVIDHYLRQIHLDVTTVRHDRISLDEISRAKPDAIVLGPGPGHPKDCSYIPIIKKFANQIPILGICLGHQAICMAFGAKILVAKRLMHGRSSFIAHDSSGCFAGLPKNFEANRYHSLIVEAESLNSTPLYATAHSDVDGYVMGVRHKSLPVEGLQFHPESISTNFGFHLLANFISSTCKNFNIDKHYLEGLCP